MARLFNVGLNGPGVQECGRPGRVRVNQLFVWMLSVSVLIVTLLPVPLHLLFPGPDLVFQLLHLSFKAAFD